RLRPRRGQWGGLRDGLEGPEAVRTRAVPPEPLRVGRVARPHRRDHLPVRLGRAEHAGVAEGGASMTMRSVAGLILLAVLAVPLSTSGETASEQTGGEAARGRGEQDRKGGG